MQKAPPKQGFVRGQIFRGWLVADFGVGETVPVYFAVPNNYALSRAARHQDQDSADSKGPAKLGNLGHVAFHEAADGEEREDEANNSKDGSEHLVLSCIG